MNYLQDLLVHFNGSPYHVPKKQRRIVVRRLAVFLVPAMAISAFAFGQQSGRKSVVPLKNSDVIDMTKAGIRTHTILLRIHQGPDSFDTSPQALIQLQKAGVKPEVMDTILLLARRSAPKLHPKPPAAPPVAPAAAVPTAGALLEKALDAFGPREELEKVNAIRWTGTAVETTADGHTTSFTEQREESYPGRLYMTVLGPAGALDKLVITPDFSYETSDRLTRAIGGESAEPYRQQIRFDPAYIAQHAQDYSIAVLGAEKKEEEASVAVLEISRGDADYLWKIDADTGRLLSIQYRMSSGEMVTREFSDYRPVGDLSFPFEWRMTEGGRTIETKINEYEVNPEGEGPLFERPANLSGTTLSFRVLDSQSIAHGQELDGNISTGCQLSQAANTSAVNPLDDINFAQRTTPSNLQMTCNSWDTTTFWPRKLNAMLVMSSDGSAYILTCDQGPRSKCAPLHAGQVFQATRTDAGIAVVGVDVKGKEQEVTYSIAQAEKLP